MRRVLFIYFLQLTITISSIVSISNGLSLEMIPIDSPQLQLLQTQHYSNPQQRHDYLVDLSLARARVHKDPTRKRIDAFNVPLYEVHSNYFLTALTIGAPAVRSYLVLDTSDVMTWVQCEGCQPCIESRYKNFDYKNSTTFRRVSPDDALCVPKLRYEGSCGFNITYPNATTSGLLGRDDFRFNNTKSQFMDVYQGLAFGCALHNQGFEFGKNKGPSNAITGVYGLAPGKRSFLTQLDKYVKGRFSYCIPSWTEQEFTQSTLYFGDDAQISGDATTNVQTISMDSSIGYNLYMNGISVDGQRLSIEPSIFKLDPVKLTKGFIIDAGSPYTVLAKSAYDPLKDAITKYFNETYGWEAEPLDENLQVCFKNHYPEEDLGFPSVSFHFGYNVQGTEVDMVLEKDNVFMKFTGVGFCLMIFATDDPGPCVLGAFQQANFKILYDVSGNLLSFVPQRCNEDEL